MNGNNPKQRKQVDKSGFFYDELDDFYKEMILLARYGFPDETKKFLKQEGRKLNKIQRKIAKQTVGTSKGKKKDWDKNKSYHKKFKTGRVYNYAGDICVRAYNSARHAHLIEYGHKKKDGTMVFGRYVLEMAKNQFIKDFEKNCYVFLDDLFSGEIK